MGAKLIIAFGHKAENGKDTAVQAIIEARDKNLGRGEYTIKRYGFADALKAEVEGKEEEFAAKYGVPFTPGTKNAPILQAHGEAMRKRNPFYWVNKMRDRVDAETCDIVLISDLRYKNEAFYVLSQGGFCIKVERVGFVTTSRDPFHKSEIDLDDFDFATHKSHRTGIISVDDGQVESLKILAVSVYDAIVDSLDYSKYFDSLSGTTVDGLNWVTTAKDVE